MPWLAAAALLGPMLLSLESLRRNRGSNGAFARPGAGVTGGSDEAPCGPALFPRSLRQAGADAQWIAVGVSAEIFHVPDGTRAREFHFLRCGSWLDPAFFEIYAVGSALLAVVRDDIGGARWLLERGKRFQDEALPSFPPRFAADSWPQRWRLDFLLGYLHGFEIGDAQAASAAFRAAGRAADAPEFLKLMADRIDRKGGLLDFTERLLLGLQRSVRSDVDREAIERKLEEVRARREREKVEP